MTSSLSTRQGLLTKMAGKLLALLEDFDKEAVEIRQIPQEELERRHLTREEELRIQRQKKCLEVAEKNVNKMLEAYTAAADELSSDTPQLQALLEKVSTNSQTAQDLLLRAQEAILELDLRLENTRFRRSPTDSAEEAPRIQLAPLPIPKFGGKAWEWESFWSAFEHSVHSRSIDDTYKMNYLLDSLRGEARESLKQFEISGRTYALAVEHLKQKYGNKQLLVEELIERLEKCRAKTRRMEDQRRLCEEIFSIVNQMELQGEIIDSLIVQKLILSKFAESLQRHALRKRQEIRDGESWHTKRLLQEVSNKINSEMEIHRHIRSDEGRLLSRTVTDSYDTQRRTNATHQQQVDQRRTIPCFYCEKKDHLPKNCPVFKTREDRLEIMRKRSLCRNCGGTNHMANQCTKGPCRLCEKHGHHTSVCLKTTPPDNTQRPTAAIRKTKPRSIATHRTKQNLVSATTANSEDDEQKEETFETSLCMRNTTDQGSSKSFVLLGAAQALNPVKQTLERVHVLLDTGADRSFITDGLANRLQLTDQEMVTLKISTFGSRIPTEKRCGITELQLWDPTGRVHRFSVARIEKIMEPLHPKTFTKDDMQFLADHKIQLSIEENVKQAQPEVLLGCSDVFSLLQAEGQRVWQLPSGIRLIPSRIGYLVAGQSQDEAATTILTIDADEAIENQDLRKKWERFLAFESAGLQDFSGTKNQEQEQVDKTVWETFESTVSLQPNGYHVRLPWTEEATKLPDNKALAYKRLCSILQRLRETPQVLEQYEQNFAEQINKGILEEAPRVNSKPQHVVHYLAHQAVITPDKEYTKLRVVYDASAHLKDKPSLNDVLQRGPVMLPAIIHMLLRFRIGQIALIADVEKAFLQVHLQTQDRDAVRCLWLRDTSLPPSGTNIVEYRFTRVPFGLKCSPFLLGATIKHHLSLPQSYNDLAQEIMDNVYVDNVILTASTEEEAVEKYLRSKAMFEEMNMNLRGFQTNNEAVNSKIPKVDQSAQKKPKVLGIPWDSISDQIQMQVSFAEKPLYTKRVVCEQIASVFDPLGWLAPIMLHGKLFLQKLWRHEYDWDTPLNEEHEKEWKRILTSISGCEIQIPRMISPLKAEAELALFADASTRALAACAYLVSEEGCHLLFAKSRLPNAGDKPTIPKMEMNAVTLATRIAYMIYQALKSKIEITSITIFSDSQITLSWLATYPIRKEFGVMVKNRISEIRKTVQLIGIPVSFGYVESAINPADCATRGLEAKEMESHPWWSGPAILRTPKETWAASNNLFDLPEDVTGEDINEENKNKCQSNTCMPTSTDIGVGELLDWKRHNTLDSAQATVAYALRFLQRITCRLKRKLKWRIEEKIPELCERYDSVYITARERRNALNVIIRNHQRIHVNENLRRSTKDLNLREDDKQLLRCYGRFERADLPEKTKYPLFIVAKTPLAQCIVRQAHLPCHLGTSHTMSRIREQFWIPKLRQQVQSHVRRCLMCQKMNNLPFRYPAMGPLPSTRVVRAKPFENAAIDYFGPLKVQQSENEGKVYGLIITCVVTRLIHIEIVMDMSAEKLLMALRRFFARRGVPTRMVSDNGPSFILGEEILRRAFQSITSNGKFQTKMAQRGIEWTTITPYAPWQGAVYERLIKSIKQSFYKTIGNRTLTVEEVATLMTEVEGCLNNRPLTYEGELFDEIKPLRPVDFLVKDMEITCPFENLQENDEDPTYLPQAEKLQLQTRRQAETALLSSQKLLERYWTIWQKMYLKDLRESHKIRMDNKRGAAKSPKLGTVVLLADPNLSRNTWRMGRIAELKEGSDSNIREAVIKMPNGNYLRRPVNLLVPLELDENSDAEEQSTGTNKSKVDTPCESQCDSDMEEQVEGRYHLRKRRKINYNEDKEDFQLSKWSTNISTIQTYILILTCFFSSAIASTTMENDVNMEGVITCRKGGIDVYSNASQKYEVCSEGFCIMLEHPRIYETIFFPPEVTLHNHLVQWKTLEKNRVKVIRKSCPAAPFCEQIRCWLCTANIFNPECHTTTAVITIMAAAYLLTAAIYTFCYVPLVLGRPCRICCKVTIGIMRAVIYLTKTFYRIWRRRRLRQRKDIDALLRAPLIAALLTLAVNPTIACQDVDIFTVKTKVCSGSNKQKCYIDTTNVVKLNTFNREACLRITKNETTLRQYRFAWKEITMECEKETKVFTRNTIQKVVDAKRCAHSGSCTGNKCENVSETTKLQELAEGNAYPGITRCVESCGGPGCGCFYLSSGCLFYRIYHEPTDREVYEVFKCRSWRERMSLEIRMENGDGRQRFHTLYLQPAVPTTIESLRFTLSSLSVPPIPALNAYFITNGEELALWEQRRLKVECSSKENAQHLNCTISHNCLCQPAELRIMCSCTDYNITDEFQNRIENRLPVRQPWGDFETSKVHEGSVMARITTLVTAELLVTIKEDIQLVTKETTDMVCRVQNALATGCYNCKRGAIAELTCTSSGERTRATVRCEDFLASIPCSAEGEISEFRFSATVARVKLSCTVTCGTRATQFEVTGILKWVGAIQESVRRIIKGKSAVEEEIVFPDFGHILETIISSYKIFAIVAACFVVAVVAGYFLLWTCGLRTITFLLRIALKVLIGTVTVPIRIVKWIFKGSLHGKQVASSQNVHIKQL